MRRLWLILALASVTGCAADRDVLYESLAEGAGLAAKYPGDQGIAQDGVEQSHGREHDHECLHCPADLGSEA